MKPEVPKIKEVKAVFKYTLDVAKSGKLSVNAREMQDVLSSLAVAERMLDSLPDDAEII